MLQCENEYHSAERRLFMQSQHANKKPRASGTPAAPVPLKNLLFFRHPLPCPPMKLHATANQMYQTVTAYDSDGVEINAVRYRHHLLVMPEMAPVAWPVASFDELGKAHFDAIAAYQPDVVIMGTGARQRFVHPALLGALTARHVGVECMDSGAACRTYNVLMGEGRRVLLALLVDAPQPA
jgi:uncharacterized protein